MITQTKGQIYLGDQRGRTEKPWHRSFHTFNYNSYSEDHKAAFGDLLVFNEDTLEAGKGISLDPAEDTCIIVLPVAGGIEFKNSEGFEDYILPGQLQVLRKNEQCPYQLINPYGLESIHYIQIVLKLPAGNAGAVIPQAFDPELRNSLSVLYSAGKTLISLGKYTGRQSDAYALSHPSNGVFVFVIQGAFEVQERLLQPKDGLALWDLAEAEFEALSNDAILLIIETPVDR